MTILKIEKTCETLNLIEFVEVNSGIKLNLMKENVKRAIKNVYYWQYANDSSSFPAMLFTVMCKADDANKLKFLKGFPDETIAYLLWYKSENPDKLFKHWGVI